MRRRFDILAISETKLDKTYPDSQFAIQGFRMCRSDRNIYGGGLMIFVLKTNMVSIRQTSGLNTSY